VRFPGDHALQTPPGVAVHRVSKSAHENPFGLRAITRLGVVLLQEPPRFDDDCGGA
jgi:hypothetical protein